MRPLFKGTLEFGLVAIPVGLMPAHSRGDVAFRTLHANCGEPIKQERTCPEHGKVEAEELVKGWEAEPGRFVLVEDSELEAIAPARSRSIEVLGTVALDDLHPLFLDRSYYLSPSTFKVSRRAYALLERALRATGTAALGRFSLWGRENHCAIAPLGQGPTLLLSTLHLGEDIVPPVEIVEALIDVDVDDEEAQLAGKLVARLAGQVEVAELESDHRARVRALLEAKLAGRPLMPPEPKHEPAALPTRDLAEALKRSIKASPRRKRRARKRVAAGSVTTR